MSKALPTIGLRKPTAEPDAAAVEKFLRSGSAPSTPPVVVEVSPSPDEAPIIPVAAAPYANDTPATPAAAGAAPPATMEYLPVRPRTTLARRDGRVLLRSTIYLDKELSKQLATVSALRNRSISDVIAEALAPHLARELKKAGA
jgi:hypothetical protein